MKSYLFFRKGVYERSEKEKKRLREARKGKHHSEEAKRKISEANKGKKLSEETKRRMSEIIKNNPQRMKEMSELGKSLSKPINMYAWNKKTCEKKFIGSYESLTECANEWNLNTCNISLVLNGKQQTHKGFVFSYVDKEISN